MHIVICAVSSARQPSGICRHAANLSAALAASLGTRVTLLVGRWQLGYFRQAFGIRDDSFLRIVPVNVARNPVARNAWYYFALPKIARDCGADLVHLSFPAPIRRPSFGCPIVVSLHDLYPYDVPRNFGLMRVMFNRIFLHGSLRSSDALVCSSDFTLERLRQYFPQIAARKAARIYQMAPLDPRSARAPIAPGLHARPFLLAVAQHRSNKKLDLLLQAFAEVRKKSRHKQLRLIIVGAEGPETGKLHALVRRLSLHAHVLFRSAITDEELAWLYQSCELLVVPSSVEGFCLPVAEGLRCGSRILCSDIPVLREIGGLSCKFVDLQKPVPSSVLAAAVEEALQQPPSHAKVDERFTEQEIGRQHLLVYSKLLAGTCRTTYAATSPSGDSRQYDRYAS